jgi:hypothetical protein
MTLNVMTAGMVRSACRITLTHRPSVVTDEIEEDLGSNSLPHEDHVEEHAPHTPSCESVGNTARSSSVTPSTTPSSVSSRKSTVKVFRFGDSLQLDMSRGRHDQLSTIQASLLLNVASFLGHEAAVLSLCNKRLDSTLISSNFWKRYESFGAVFVIVNGESLSE